MIQKIWFGLGLSRGFCWPSVEWASDWGCGASGNGASCATPVSVPILAANKTIPIELQSCFKFGTDIIWIDASPRETVALLNVCAKEFAGFVLKHFCKTSLTRCEAIVVPIRRVCDYIFVMFNGDEC